MNVALTDDDKGVCDCSKNYEDRYDRPYKAKFCLAAAAYRSLGAFVLAVGSVLTGSRIDGVEWFVGTRTARLHVVCIGIVTDRATVAVTVYRLVTGKTVFDFTRIVGVTVFNGTCIDDDNRRKQEQDGIRFYHEELCITLTRLEREMADPNGFVSDYSDDDESQIVTRQEDATQLLKRAETVETPTPKLAEHSLEMNSLIDTLDQVAKELTQSSLDASADTHMHPCHANRAVVDARDAARHMSEHNDTAMLPQVTRLTQTACYELKRLGHSQTDAIREALERVTV